MELIGQSPAFVIGYLEAKFKEGRAWDNDGEWHIDHIKPSGKFNLLDKVFSLYQFATLVGK